MLLWYSQIKHIFYLIFYLKTIILSSSLLLPHALSKLQGLVRYSRGIWSWREFFLLWYLVYLQLMHGVLFSSMQEKSNKLETVSLLTASNSLNSSLGSGYQLLKQTVLQLFSFSLFVVKFYSLSVSFTYIHILLTSKLPSEVVCSGWLKCLHGLWLGQQPASSS